MQFIVEGEAVPKSRPRFANGRAYTPKRTKDYEQKVREAYTGDMYPAGIPLKMLITAYFAIPKSATVKASEEMIKGLIRPLKRPDADNIAKAICDALNGVAYADDKQIVRLTVAKYYSIWPRVEIEIDEVKA